MKAIAKHDCYVSPTTSMDILSLNHQPIKAGTEIIFPVFSDEKITHESVAAVLGNRMVIFQDGAMLIPTYSKDFDYVEEPVFKGLFVGRKNINHMIIPIMQYVGTDGSAKKVAQIRYNDYKPSEFDVTEKEAEDLAQLMVSSPALLLECERLKQENKNLLELLVKDGFYISDISKKVTQ